jgi:predicted RNase H-like nuclease (RuvC/YqgF family)
MNILKQNPMLLTKRLPLIVSLTSALTLACLTVYQSDVINDLRNLLQTTNEKLVETRGQLEIEVQKNEDLERQVLVLNDSISLLNARIEDFKVEINRLKSKVKQLNGRIQQQEDKVKQLTEAINKLKADNSEKSAQVAKLEEERNKLLISMEAADKVRIEMQEEINRLRAQLGLASEQAEATESRLDEIRPAIKEEPAPPMTGIEDEKVEHAPQKKLASILGFTEVQFGEIVVKEDQNGPALKRAGNNWQYVMLNFALNHQDPEVLVGEEFLVQVYDLDQHKVVPFNEFNPEYPDSPVGNKGYSFVYQGQPVGIKYFNSQKKESKNYELRLYYYKDGMIYQLRNNRVKIIERGKVVTR